MFFYSHNSIRVILFCIRITVKEFELFPHFGHDGSIYEGQVRIPAVPGVWWPPWGAGKKKLKEGFERSFSAGTHLEKKSWGLGSSRDCQGRRMQGRDTSLFLFLGFWKLVSRSSSSRDCQGNSKEK